MKHRETLFFLSCPPSVSKINTVMKLKSLIKKVVKSELETTNLIIEARLAHDPELLKDWKLEYANLEVDWKEIETLQELVQFIEDHCECRTDNVLEYIVEEYILS